MFFLKENTVINNYQVHCDIAFKMFHISITKCKVSKGKSLFS